MYELGRFTILGQSEKGVGIRLLPCEHLDAYPFWNESTRTVLDAFSDADVANKRVLDFGCGPWAILGLCAKFAGAKEVRYAEKNAELWRYAKKTIESNHQTPLRDNGSQYDFVFANVGDDSVLAEAQARGSHGIGTNSKGEIVQW